MQESHISNELLAILVCPETKTQVRLAPDAIIDRLNSLISQGKLQNKAGKIITEKINAGLLREDSKILYPIIDGIPIMLVEEGILIEN